MRNHMVLAYGLAAALILPAGAAAQTASGTIRQFEERCATCHRNAGVAHAQGAEQAPDFATLQKLAPDTIYAALTNNPVAAHAQADLTDALKRGFAEFVGGRKLGSVAAGAATAMANRCPAGPLADPAATPGWNGWGVDASNARFQPASAAGMMWQYDTLRAFTTVNGVAASGGAMGAPGPTVAGGMLFVGSGYTGLGNGRGGNVLLAFAPE